MEKISKDGHSHQLAMKYKQVSESGIDTRGEDYLLPKFKAAENSALAGKRVLIISADGPELPELDVPLEYLKARGAEVELAGQSWIFQYRWPNDGSKIGEIGNIVIAQFLADDIYVQVDLSLRDVKVENYDAIFIPGGAWNPDMLRTDEDALRVVREARAKGKLIVSVCHGPQVLINADRDGKRKNVVFPAGTKITGVSSIRVDLENAGFTVLDQVTVYDEACNLLTAPSPKELGPLCEEMGRLLAAKGK
jgi:protease I